MRTEVTYPAAASKKPSAPARGDLGRFSGTEHAFRAAEQVLQKYALLDGGNGAEMLSRLFRKSNFGYGPAPKGSSNPRRLSSWSEGHTGGTELGDRYGMGPAPLTRAV